MNKNLWNPKIKELKSRLNRKTAVHRNNLIRYFVKLWSAILFQNINSSIKIKGEKSKEALQHMVRNTQVNLKLKETRKARSHHFLSKSILPFHDLFGARNEIFSSINCKEYLLKNFYYFTDVKGLKSLHPYSFLGNSTMESNLHYLHQKPSCWLPFPKSLELWDHF